MQARARFLTSLWVTGVTVIKSFIPSANSCSKLVSSWILTSHQPHKVTPGRNSCRRRGKRRATRNHYLNLTTFIAASGRLPCLCFRKAYNAFVIRKWMGFWWKTHRKSLYANAKKQCIEMFYRLLQLLVFTSEIRLSVLSKGEPIFKTGAAVNFLVSR